MFADEDEDGRGAVPKLRHGPDTRFNLVSRNVLIERSGVDGVEFSSDQDSDNLHTDMVFLLRHKQHYVTHGRDISFGLYIVFV